MSYDAILLLSFGGPEKREEVMPFLENVLRGRNVPRERMLEVAEHYYHFGGRSPINGYCRELLAAMRASLPLPVYWGNRNWHPLLAETMRQMARDGVRRALALATSAYAGYSGCRQYLENIETARREVGEDAPVVDKIPPFCAHPLFVQANAERVREAMERIAEAGRPAARVVYTAHSIPVAMAASGHRRLGRSVAEPQRAACAALARARHFDPPAGIGSSRGGRRADSAHRIPFRSHGSSLRPGRGSRGSLLRPGTADDARRNRRPPSHAVAHDRRIGPGGYGRARTSGLRRRLLPASATAAGGEAGRSPAIAPFPGPARPRNEANLYRSQAFDIFKVFISLG